MSKNLYKHPKLYDAFDLYCRQWCYELPADEELAHITFSPAFEERIRRVLRRQACGFYVLFGTVGRSVASVLVALLVGITVTTFSVRALREPVVRFITQVFDTFTSILFVDDAPAVTDEVFNAVVPDYIPEGYEVERQTSDGETMHRIMYYNTVLRDRLVYTQSWQKDGVLTADTEDVIHHNVLVNGMDGIAYQNKGSFTILFICGDYAYSISGSLPEELLLRIAESIPLE